MSMHRWHEGETAIHKRLKLDHINGEYAQSITSSMPAQHQHFFSSLPYFITCTLDDNGRPWGSILCGPTGFIRSISPNHLAFCTTIAESDPIYKNLQNGGKIAGLGIQFLSRRRNKVYGTIMPSMVKTMPGREIQAIITTSESLGNCPKYITSRSMEYHTRIHGPITHGTRLSDDACQMVSLNYF